MDDDRGAREGHDADDAERGRPDLRVGDADRQAALEALGAHLQAGRLDVDEYGDRSAHAAVAVRRAELSALFDDLPAPHPPLPERPTAPAVPAVPEPAPVPRRDDHRPAAHAAAVGLVLVLMVALPGILLAAASGGVGGGGLLFLPLLFLLLGGAGRGHRRFGPGGPGRHGPWHR